MPRRGKNIYKRKDGRWEGRCQKERSDGKRGYHSIYGKSYKEVAIAMAEYEAAQPKREFPNKLTVWDAILEWLSDHKCQWKESTYSCYVYVAQKQIQEMWKNKKISLVTQEMYSSYFVELRNKNGLSYNYLHLVHVILNQAISYASQKRGMQSVSFQFPIQKNSLKKTPALDILSEANLKKMKKYLKIHAGEKDGTCLALLTCCSMGLRVGEVCALCWEDIDLDKGIIHIHHTMQRISSQKIGKKKTKVIIAQPKSSSSYRDIPIPPFLWELLKKYQGEGYLVKGKRKHFAEPRTLQYRFATILKQCNIPLFNIHKLRHFFATSCISQGFDLRTVSELLGHSNVSITLAVYVHSDMERKRKLMEEFQF